MDTAVIFLTWKRLNSYSRFLDMLDSQTILDFDLFVSNANPEMRETIDCLNAIERKYKIKTVESFQETHPFRRFDLAKSLNYERYIFIDDDVIFPSDFIEKCCSKHEEKTYASWWAWRFKSKNDYWQRERITDPHVAVHYGGAGVSVIDAEILKCSILFDDSVRGAKIFDDLWVSYVVDHVLGWKIKYLDIEGVFFSNEADDDNALYRISLSADYTKNDFYNDLIEKGWNPN
jgi:hypothetical protein